MLVRVRLMELPEATEAQAPVLALAGRLAMLVRHASESFSQRIDAWLRERPVSRRDTGPFHADELGHELSAWMAPLASESSDDGRTFAESRFLPNEGFPTGGDVKAGGCDLFNHSLVRLHACLEPDSAGFRTAPAASMPDKSGVGVLYVAPELIHARMQAIYGHWSRHVGTHPGFAAIMAMTALMNLHPFMDGNGRVARVLFHWTLNRHSEEPVYLPLHELSAPSRCGYLVRLRQAQYHGEFEPLLAYLIMVAERWMAEDTPHIDGH